MCAAVVPSFTEPARAVGGRVFGGRATGRIPGLAGLAAGTAAAALGLGYVTVRPRLLTWGATPAEVSAPMAGDELVQFPRYRTTHAISIAAPPRDVWPWLAQLGQGRGGLYSYDWLENLIGCGVHSVDAVVPQWQTVAVDDEVRLVRDDHPVPLVFRVALVDPPNRLVLVPPGTPEQAFDAGLPYVTWSFGVEEQLRGCSRLVVRMRGDFRPSASTMLADKYLLEPVHWLMERKMLTGIRRRSERRAERRASRESAIPAPRAGEPPYSPG